MKLHPGFLRAVAAIFSAFALFVSTPAGAAPAQHSSRETGHAFAIGTNDFLLDGQRFQIRCGEIHAARVPREYWRNRLQMAKAMGLNTVCAYLFWNQIEPEPGKFDWSGQADIAEFCRIAQQEGLWVILRPGPYACAEWDGGGLPWWLLKYDDIQLRTRDPRYLDAAKKYLREVGKKLAPLQITRGGPIVMVQVENEYGFYGKDKDYLGELRQSLLDGGFNVTLFCCDPPYALKDGWRPDLFPVVNFGSDPAGAFKALRGILPQGPLMCGEFYPGWFDTWGAPHHLGNEPRYLGDLEYMLKNGESFSIYMAHGGTTFGLWSGADRPFKPDTSSYDYDAPISEAGWPTEKFFKTRDLFAKYLLPGETIPDPPATNATISIPSFELTDRALLFGNLPKGISDKYPQSMEKYDQGHGCIVYRTTIPFRPGATLEVAGLHDFGFVFLNGQRIGVMDRRTGNFKVHLPDVSSKQAIFGSNYPTNVSETLDILVEAMGHVNFGQEVHDRKGIHEPVKLDEQELSDWQIFNLPLDSKMLGKLKFLPQTGMPPVSIFKRPSFWRGTFEIDKPGDTFLDLRSWGKGVVWVNGHCLGRFWNIGPTQTAYTPGCWLHHGKNEIVILDLLSPEQPFVAGLEKPILNELHPEKDFAQVKRPKVTLKLDTPAIEAQFAPGTQTQDVKFGATAKGRYFCLETLSAFDGKPFAAVAELDLLDTNGNPLSHEGWRIAYVDSEERLKEDGSAENAIDGQTANYWHTEWSAAQPDHPHRLMIDLAQSQTISGFRYVPRQGGNGVGGRIKDYRVYVGDDLIVK
jgi:beta-galactosidase